MSNGITIEGNETHIRGAEYFQSAIIAKSDDDQINVSVFTRGGHTYATFTREQALGMIEAIKLALAEEVTA